jgi:hypothetical protein
MPMTEAEWLACTDPTPTLEFLRDRGSDRKMRLFACACCRRIWRLYDDEWSPVAVEVAERHADGLVTNEQMILAHRAIFGITGNPTRWKIGSSAVLVANAAKCASSVPTSSQAARIAAMAAKKGATTRPSASVERKEQTRLLPCIFGNPFHTSLPLPPPVLAWNDGTVRRLAAAIYDDRRLPEGTLDPARLAILADALLDAGYDNEALIQHCRQPGPHVRGCWAIDLILGKQ